MKSLAISKSVLTLIVLFSLGALLGVTVYLLSLKKSSSVVTPNIDISDWETYTNNDAGYEFKHPKDVQAGYMFGDTGNHHDKFQPITVIGSSLSNAFDIGVGDNPEGLPLEKWLNEEPSGTTPIYKTRKDAINNVLGGINTNSSTMGLSYSDEKITVDGIEGVDLMLSRYGNPYIRSIIIPKGKKVYIFSRAPIKDNIFEKMLSTFKFIEE